MLEDLASVRSRRTRRGEPEKAEARGDLEGNGTTVVYV